MANDIDNIHPSKIIFNSHCDKRGQFSSHSSQCGNPVFMLDKILQKWVCSAILSFNDGRSSIASVMEKYGLYCYVGYYTKTVNA